MILLVNAVALSKVRAGIVLAAINVGINCVDFTMLYSEFQCRSYQLRLSTKHTAGQCNKWYNLPNLLVGSR